MTLVGTLEGGGTVSDVVITNGLAGLTHISFGTLFQDITQVAWTPSNGAQNDFLQFDNVLVDTAVAPISEPASAAVLTAGMVGLGLVRRRRR